MPELKTRSVPIKFRLDTADNDGIMGESQGNTPEMEKIMESPFIKQVVASYTYPDHPMVCDVVGYYTSWKKLYMDEVSHYCVYDENGEKLDDNDTIWTSVPSREDVRERYVEVTYS